MQWLTPEKGRKQHAWNLTVHKQSLCGTMWWPWRAVRRHSERGRLNRCRLCQSRVKAIQRSWWRLRGDQ